MSLQNFEPEMIQNLHCRIRNTVVSVLILLTEMIFFSQNEDERIDVRHYVIALSTVHRPSESMKTLKLAFKVSAFTTVTVEMGLKPLH